MVEQQPQEEPNPLMRKKKTPEELAAEAEQEDLDEFTSKCLAREIKIQQATHRCFCDNNRECSASTILFSPTQQNINPVLFNCYAVPFCLLPSFIHLINI